VSALSAALRRCLIVVASSLALLPALAPAQNELPFDKVSGSELRQALIWTSHLELWDGDPVAAVQKATKSWQASKGYKATETLSEDQTSELLAEAVKKRESVGWSMLNDKSTGLAVGVPTRLVKYVATRPINGGIAYDFDGTIGWSLGTRYGDITCSNFGVLYGALKRQMRGTWMVSLGDMFAIFEKKDGRQTYLQATCRTSGAAVASVTLTDTQAQTYGMLYGALADSR
jgi:hypothetical protein